MIEYAAGGTHRVPGIFSLAGIGWSLHSEQRSLDLLVKSSTKPTTARKSPRAHWRALESILGAEWLQEAPTGSLDFFHWLELATAFIQSNGVWICWWYHSATVSADVLAEKIIMERKTISGLYSYKRAISIVPKLTINLIYI